MYKPLAAIAVVVSVASAIPVARDHSLVGNSTSSTIVPTPIPTSSASVPIKSGNPFSFPLPNGFNGTLNGSALKETNLQAQGTQPNGGAPTLSEDDIISIQLIAFNEIFEVAFFTDLLYNVTKNVTGFTVSDNGIGIDALTAIQAQEELHAANANAILTANGRDAIQPCQYVFPTTSLDGALALAKTFTDVVLGTLQDVQFHLASNGAAAVVPIIGSVIGQEGEQTGFFRQSAGLIPSSQPFLTRSTREFAFSALNQIFVVPGSCPNADEINLPVFASLTVTTPQITAVDQTLSFAVAANSTASLDDTSIVYLNAQNTPIVQSITNIASGAAMGMVTFDAEFPYAENLMNGLTIAALVSGSGPFASVEDVAMATIAGPGLIEIN